MLQLYPVYLLWNRRKTLTGSPDPTRMQTVHVNLVNIIYHLFTYLYRNGEGGGCVSSPQIYRWTPDIIYRSLVIILSFQRILIQAAEVFSL